MFLAERLASHVFRTVFLVAAMTLYFLAIARIRLATAVSAYFVGPVVAVVLSRCRARGAHDIPEGAQPRIGIRRIACVILRPGGSMDAGILLALGAGVLFAFYLIATRRAAEGSDPLKTLAFQCVVGTILLTPQAIASWSAPAWGDLLFFAGLGLFSVIGHMLSIVALRLVDASTLAPLVYVELIGAALIGYLASAEIPRIPTMVGAGFIVLAGLILLQRQQTRAPGD
jgi:drug/metabolite transporter (DMT)-like permease